MGFSVKYQKISEIFEDIPTDFAANSDGRVQMSRGFVQKAPNFLMNCVFSISVEELFSKFEIR